jgi:hypothetical protein
MDSWEWPQWVMAGLMTFRLLAHAAHTGKPMKQDYNFAMALMRAAIGGFVLWKGGFWK